MTSFVSIDEGYSLFLKHTPFGQPIEKCNTRNFKQLQENCFWVRINTENIAEMHYFKTFQYPIKKFPGLSIIKAYAKGIEINDECSYFLANFMTIDETRVIGNADISEEETKMLAEEIVKSFDYFEFTVVGRGQILAWFPGKYPFFEWKVPFELTGLDYTSCLPDQGGFKTLIRVISNSWRTLKDHPVNRVRIDLGENPANFIWFHSQNKHIGKIETLSEKIKSNTIFWPNTSALSDFARYLGFKVIENLPTNPEDNIFLWVDINLKSEDVIGLIKKWESADSRIVPKIIESSKKMVMEFNNGFKFNRRAVCLFYPGQNIGFLRRIIKPGNLPARFLFSNG